MGKEPYSYTTGYNVNRCAPGGHFGDIDDDLKYVHTFQSNNSTSRNFS